MVDRRDPEVSTRSARRSRRSCVRSRVGVLAIGVRRTDAVAAVLCILAQRLSGGAARNLVAPLPESLRPRACVR
jgi:hypothetical protein